MDKEDEERELEGERLGKDTPLTPRDLVVPESAMVPTDGVYCNRLDFVDNSWFQFLVGIAIAANVLELAVQTDVPRWGGWPLCDNIFLALFTAELSLRLLYKGRWFFTGTDRWWHALDITVVGSGLIDIILTHPGLLLEGQSSHLAGLPILHLRSLRLIRLLRLLRVFKMFPRLMAFLWALWMMLSTFIWIFIVLFLFILVSAIVLTQQVGNMEVLHDGQEGRVMEDARRSVAEQFHNVRSSLFLLFQVTTQDNWEEIARPIIVLNPHMRLFFVFFITFASWTLISVLTAVASDSMIAATSNRKDAERHEQERRQRSFMTYLRSCFYDADADGNGLLDREEFEALIAQPVVVSQMHSSGVKLSQEEMRKAWAMLDVDGSGQLTIDAFVEGLSYLQETLSVKHVVNIDYSVKRTAARLEKHMDRLVEDLFEVQAQNAFISQALRDQETRQLQIDLSLEAWRFWAASNARDSLMGDPSYPVRSMSKAEPIKEESGEDPGSSREVPRHDQALQGNGNGHHAR